jgi:CRP/FNR family cyclic AMP-dependent transcriptional regulator
MPLTTEEKRAWLAKVPLFRGCNSEVTEQLADLTAESTFAPDQPIVMQGQVGNGLHVIVTGGARIVAGSDELARFGPGDVLGELSVIDQRPRTATAYAVGPTTCLALASWDLMTVMEREPRLALNLLKELASRLRSADEQLSR